MSTRDPFYAVKDRITLSLNTLQTEIPQWLDFSPQNPEFNSKGSSIKGQLKQCMVDLHDLAETISIVEQHRSRFAAISEKELEQRRQFVSEAKQQCQQLAERVKERQKQVATNEKPKPVSLTSDTDYTPLSSRPPTRQSNNREVAVRSQAHLSLVQQQDEVLEDMSSALARLQGISTEINQDLREHADLLNDMDAEMDEAHGNMGVVLRKVDKLLKSSDRGRNFCILIILAIDIMLFFLILF